MGVRTLGVPESLDNIKNMVGDLLHRNIQLAALKNNDYLNRHLVFRVIENGKSQYVAKFFNTSEKFQNEVRTLKLLNKYKIKAPKLINYKSYGSMNYTLTEFIEGNQMSQVFNKQDIQKQNDLLREVGLELGKMHNISGFKTFGQWDDASGVYYDKVLEGLERTANVFIRNKNEDLELINKAVKMIKKNKKVFLQVKQGTLCHKDFQAKNLIISDENKLNAIIDFESSVPWCKEYDFCIFYHNLLKDRSDLIDSFMYGYKKMVPVDENFKILLNLHLILEGLKICRFRYAGWDPKQEFYHTGINLIKMQLKT